MVDEKVATVHLIDPHAGPLEDGASDEPFLMFVDYVELVNQPQLMLLRVGRVIRLQALDHSLSCGFDSPDLVEPTAPSGPRGALRIHGAVVSGILEDGELKWRGRLSRTLWRGQDVGQLVECGSQAVANISDQNFQSIWGLPVDKGSENVLSRGFPPSDQTIWPCAKIGADLSL